MITMDKAEALSYDYLLCRIFHGTKTLDFAIDIVFSDIAAISPPLLACISMRLYTQHYPKFHMA